MATKKKTKQELIDEEVLTDGEWCDPVKKGFELSCCDCGLSHIFHFEIRDNKVWFRLWRKENCPPYLKPPTNKKKPSLKKKTPKKKK